MKTKLRILALLFISLFEAKAQDDSLLLKKNAIYFEFAGNGLIFSVNYERLLFQKRLMHLRARVGAGRFPGSHRGYLEWDGFFTLPVEINALIGKRNNFFEAGIGNTFSSSKDGIEFSSLRLGYRFEQEDGGFLVRLAPMLIYIHQQNKNQLSPFFGISVGGTF